MLSKGAGMDVISDFDTTANNSDIVQFQNVRSNEVSAVQKVGSNLVLKYGAADQVTVENYFDANNALAYRIERFAFSDSVIWTHSQIQAKAVEAPSTTSANLSVDRQLSVLVDAMAAFSPQDAASLNLGQTAYEPYTPMLATNNTP
ncbi:calcium-binding protein [Chitinimonas sp. PSY-7]|uniref:calcium-binding protein n=1 Tax=Chitinimonas sp. PSY-7 TaxID=3459088 RepID=UPI0040403791